MACFTVPAAEFRITRGAPPKEHTHAASRLRRVALDDGLPTFPAARP